VGKAWRPAGGDPRPTADRRGRGDASAGVDRVRETAYIDRVPPANAHGHVDW